MPQQRWEKRLGVAKYAKTICLYSPAKVTPRARTKALCSAKDVCCLRKSVIAFVCFVFCTRNVNHNAN